MGEGGEGGREREGGRVGGRGGRRLKWTQLCTQKTVVLYVMCYCSKNLFQQVTWPEPTPSELLAGRF